MMKSEKIQELKRTIDFYNLHYNEIKAISRGIDKEINFNLARIVDKEFVDGETLPANIQHNLNIKKLKQVLVSDDNYLDFMCEFVEDEQKEFLLILSNTALAKIYYETYCEKWRDYKEKKMDKAKENIFEKVIEVVKMDKNLDDQQAENDDTIKYLYGLSRGLQNKHYTERQFYENFLFRMFKFLEGKYYRRKYGNLSLFSKNKILEVVNSIIEKYFDSTITFTAKTKIENFIPINYIYESAAGIDLIHSRA